MTTKLNGVKVAVFITNAIKCILIPAKLCSKYTYLCAFNIYMLHITGVLIKLYTERVQQKFSTIALNLQSKF